MRVMTNSDYKGFNIVARPYLLYESGRWAADLEISRRDRTQLFGLAGRYATEQEADTRCSGLGRRIIDGEIPGWTVDRLRRAPRHRLAVLHKSQGGFMRPLIIAGILVAALGAFMLVRGPGFNSLSDMGHMGVGNTTAMANGRQSAVPWVGGVVLLVGLGLIVVSARKRA
jgi:hypothetical protein